MTKSNPNISQSGSSKVWSDFARVFDAEIDSLSEIDSMSFDGEFRDEYVRLPYEDLLSNQECSW